MAAHSHHGQAINSSNRGIGSPLAFCGAIIHSVSVQEVEFIENGLIVIGSDGKIAVLKKNVEEKQIKSILSEHGLTLEALTALRRGQFLIPGFCDTHNHAPQWAQRGTGRGDLLMDWLNKITFPHEAKFEDLEYARKTYASCVDGFIKQGITTASYYGSLHGEATKILAEICLEKGQRAYVGKCNMNRNSPDFYRDASAEESLRVTEDFIAHVRRIDPTSEIVKPIITPRFAVACDADVLAGLGKILAQNPHLPMQTHFNEAIDEMRITKELYPEFSNEADLYHHFGLLNPRSILAHCVFLTDYEMGRLKSLNCGVAHCPIANTTTGNFMAAPILEYLRRGIKVGLGTDSGGGFSSSILDAMRHAFIVSQARKLLTHGKDRSLTLHECFHMATLGGAHVCCLDDRTGNFAVGKEFDALWVDTVDQESAGVVTLVEDVDPLRVIFEKFLMTGDDRNIRRVFVRGRSIK